MTTGVVPEELTPPPPQAPSTMAVANAGEFLMMASRLLRQPRCAPTLEPPFALVPSG
jgi:hypothetical protein